MVLEAQDLRFKTLAGLKLQMKSNFYFFKIRKSKDESHIISNSLILFQKIHPLTVFSFSCFEKDRQISISSDRSGDLKVANLRFFHLTSCTPWENG